MSPLIEVSDLSIAFGDEEVVRGVNFTIEAGETVALVGESGSGKTVTALSIPQLLPYPHASHPTGSIKLDGEEMIGAGITKLLAIRGSVVSMIFQEPMSSLNPLHKIGKQVSEMLVLDGKLTKGQAGGRVRELFDLVGLDESIRIDAYPHELSGGQRQRVMIALALAQEPRLLIADEPTTALDVTIQKQILDLIKNLIEDLGMAMILISHNLAVISQNVQDVIVMYGGTRVESGPTNAVFSDLSHPYSQGLFSAVPQIDDTKASRRRLTTIPGTVPELADLPAGCTFQERCTYVTDACRPTPPPVVQVGEGHNVACLHIEAARTAWGAR